MCSNQNKFQCSVSVIPIVNVDKIYVDIIQKSMQKIIPYIEELTQVRYYPVTTYIVDDYTIESKYKESIKIESDAFTLEDVKEVLKFLSWIAIGYHTKRFYPNGENLDYKDFSNLAQEQLEKLKCISEYMCFYLEDYLEDKNSKDAEELYIEGISKDANIIGNFFDDFKEILNIFRKIINTLELEDIMLKYDDRRAYPRLKVWQENLSSRHFGIIRKFVDDEGKWANKLTDLIKVVEITLEMLKNMLDKYKIANNEFSNIIKEIHTYGVYLHKSESSYPQFAKILRSNGFPEGIEQFNTGKVLICIDKIMERVDQAYEANPTLDKDWLNENLITATLVHEHTHAANFEGVRYNHSQPLFTSHKNDNNHTYKVVTEALAEWSELNYFRDNAIMSEIIKAHINSGDIKNWPYAGAGLIEKRFNELGVTDFQVIFNMSRVSYKNAYEILR